MIKVELLAHWWPCMALPLMLFGSKSRVLVLQRRLSPVPSIQMYMTCTLSPCGSAMYCCFTTLLSCELADVAMFITLQHLNKQDRRIQAPWGLLARHKTCSVNLSPTMSPTQRFQHNCHGHRQSDPFCTVRSSLHKPQSLEVVTGMVRGSITKHTHEWRHVRNKDTFTTTAPPKGSKIDTLLHQWPRYSVPIFMLLEKPRKTLQSRNLWNEVEVFLTLAQHN